MRKGLEQLARRGLITTRTGIGSFVTYGGASLNSALGWTLALSRTADEIETRILALERRASPSTSDRLEIEQGDFLCVDRLRLLRQGGPGISLERSRSPWRDEFDSVLASGLTNGSLGETFATMGLEVDHGEEWAEVLPELTEHDAEIMRRRPGEAMLRLRRVTRTAAGDVIEFVESTLDPTRFGLHLEF